MTDAPTPPDDGATPPPSRRQVLADIAAALRLGSHVIDRFPEQLDNQLRARLTPEIYGRLRNLPARRGPWPRLDTPSLAPVGGPLRRILAGHRWRFWRRRRKGE